MAAPVLVCARCGEILAGAVARCPACNGAVAGSVLGATVVGPLASGAEPASNARRAVSCTVSIGLPVLLGALVAAAVLGRGVAAAVLWGVLALAVVAVVELALWLRSGRSFGAFATSTRTVRADDGTALSWRGLGSPFSRRARGIPAPDVTQGPIGLLFGATTVVVRGDRDPLALAPRGIPSLPPRVPGAVARDAHTPALILVFDGRVRVPLVRGVVLGRNPAPLGGEIVAVALPDMSRSISKAHLRLDRAGATVFAEDLGSTNGTELVIGDSRTDLRAGVRVEVPVGAHLLLAGHALRFESREGTAV